MLPALLALSLSAAPVAPSPQAVTERWLSFVAPQRCDLARGDDGITLLSPSWVNPTLTVWKSGRFTSCALTVANVPQSLSVAAHSLLTQPAPVEDAPIAQVKLADTAASFAKVFGMPAPKLESATFNRYTSRQLERLFAAFYVKPDAPLAGTTAQVVYDRLFKRRVEATVKHLVFLEQNLSAADRAAMLKSYQAEAKKVGAAFDGNDFLRGLITARFPSPNELWNAERVLGVMLRRSMDGTWATVRKLTVGALHDYDPPLAAQLTPSK